MNVKSLLLLLAFTGLGAGCTDDIAEKGSGGNTNGRPELQIAFSGTGESQSYDTKAIATAKENQIDNLKIYLFAAASDGGPFYYLETWEDGTAYNPATPAVTQFKKTEAGSGWKASLYPGELQGLPWIKLYCVANNGAAGVLASDGMIPSKTSDGKFYDEAGAAEQLALMEAVTTHDAAGDGNFTVLNPTTATTEADFLKTFTPTLTFTNTGGNGTISTPLLMTGSGMTKISGSVSKVNIDLKRIMARFDIDNTVTKSNLTITKVTMAQGRKTAPLWDAALITPVDKADLTTDAKIAQKYDAILFDKLPGANTGVTESSLYVYPTLATDESFLILEGTFKSPTTSEQVEVTYHVPIVRTPEGADKGTPIAIEANNRYCLRISDVTVSNVFGTFDVIDWTSAGGITIRPDNDAPVFAGAAAFTGANKPTRLAGINEADTFSYEVTGTDGAGAFTLSIAATGRVRHEAELATTKAGIDWLTITPGEQTEVDGVWYNKFDFAYTGAIGQQPVAVHFINDAASFDPSLWTTLKFYGPKAVPALSVVAGGNSKGNLTNTDDPKKPTASIYNVKGSFVLFDILSIEGVKAELGTAKGYKMEELSTNEFTHRYKIYTDDAATAEGGTILFKNAGDETKVTTLTVTKTNPSLVFKEVTDAESVGDLVNGTETPYPTTGTLKLDLDKMQTKSASYIFTMKAPEDLSLNSADCPWLKITPSTWSAADSTVQYTLEYKASASTDDFKMVFTNKLNEGTINTAPGYTLTLHKDFSKPQLAAPAATTGWSAFNAAFAADAIFTDPTDASIKMYNLNGSKISVMMDCSEAAAFDNVDGLTVAKVGDTNEYTIEIADTTKLTAPTSKLVAYNTGAKTANPATDRKAELTITWVSPEITLEALATGAATPTITGLNVTVPNDFKRYTDASFKIVGYTGSAITYPDVTGKWCSFDVAPATIGGAGTATVTILGTADVADTSTLSITVHNAVKNEDVTINISKAP